MVERLLLLLLLILALFVLGLLFRAWWRWRRKGTASLDLSAFAADKPTILFFSGEGCSQCHTLQAPALARLQQELDGKVKVVEIDALSRPDLASALAVLTLPTTVILDSAARVRRTNDGFADSEKLRLQLEEIENDKGAAGSIRGH